MEQKVAFITGASSGIGEALALEYARNGFHLVLSARRMDLLQIVQQNCLSLGVKCEVMALDVALPDTFEAKIEQAIGFFGRMDVLINNAGISQRGTAAETTTEVTRNIMEVNFFGAVGITRLLLPELRKNKGYIGVISSMSGLFGFPQRSTYAATKFALHGYFETLALEEPEISVTIVCPGRIKTNISLNALSADGTPHGVMDQGQLKGIDVQVCAKKIFAAIKNKKHMVIIARSEKILHYIKKFFPSLFFVIARKIKPN